MSRTGVTCSVVLILSSLASPAGAASIGQLFFADQATRGRFKDGQIYDRDDESRQDAKRRASLFRLLVEKLELGPEELIQSAIILQHTNSDWPEEDGEIAKSQDNHLLAFFLARKAYLAGHKDGAWVMSVTLARWLQISNIPSELGVETKELEGKVVVVPISPDISDSERTKLGVPFDVERALREP